MKIKSESIHNLVAHSCRGKEKEKTVGKEDLIKASRSRRGNRPVWHHRR